MSALDKLRLDEKKVRQMGPWAGVRYLRNQGYPFDVAHEIVLGRMPRF